MGFKSLFKVRQPGHGNAWHKKAESATRAKISIAGPIDNTFKSKGKKGV